MCVVRQGNAWNFAKNCDFLLAFLKPCVKKPRQFVCRGVILKSEISCASRGGLAGDQAAAGEVLGLAKLEIAKAACNGEF